MTAGPSSSFSRQNHDLQNQAIKSLFAQNPKIPSCPRILPSTVVEPKEGSTQIVKVREAWAPFPEEAAKVTDGVVRRVQRERSGLRRFSEHSNRDDAESDAINNNGNDGEEDQCNAEVNHHNITAIVVWLVYIMPSKRIHEIVTCFQTIRFRPTKMRLLQNEEAIILRNTFHKFYSKNHSDFYQINHRNHGITIFQR